MVLLFCILFCALYFTCGQMFEQLRREYVQGSGRRNNVYPSRYRLDLRLVRTATLPMLVGIVVLSYIFKGVAGNLLAISGLLVINGLLVFIPGRMLQGNKNAGNMTQFDAILIGLCGSIGSVAGLSTVGGVTGVSICRGADRQRALNWAFMLSVPVLVTFSVLDIIQIFSAEGILFWSSLFTYFLSGLGAFAGGYVSIRLARLFISRAGFSGFAYYCWGAALLSFLLYLFAV